MEPLPRPCADYNAFLSQLNLLESEIWGRGVETPEAELGERIVQFLKDNEVFVERGLQDSQGDLKTRLNSLKEKITKANFEDLPEELRMRVLSYLNLRDLGRFSAVSRDSKRIADDPQLMKTAIYQKFALGKALWESLGVKVEETLEQEVNSLPNDISKILGASCPVFDRKTVGETHVLVRLPRGLSLNQLQKVAKKLFPDNPDGFRFIWDVILLALGEKPQEKSEWVLMTQDVLPGSRFKNFEQQQARVKELAETSEAPYEVPYTLPAVACMLARYAGSDEAKTGLFSDVPWTATRTLDKVQGCRVVVGGCARTGLNVISHDFDNAISGVAALRKL